MKNVNNLLLQNTVPNYSQQMVYLLADSMDTILYFGKEITQNQEIYTLDLGNPETQIKVSFLLCQKDNQEHQNKLVGFRSSNPRILAQIAPGIQLISSQDKKNLLI